MEQLTAKRFENRLNKDNVKFNILNPVWDNEKEDALNVFEMIDLLNELHDENQRLKGKVSSWKITASEEISEKQELMKQIVELKEENDRLNMELKGIMELLKSYQKTVRHDAKLLADATKKGYLPPLEDWEEL